MGVWQENSRRFRLGSGWRFEAIQAGQDPKATPLAPWSSLRGPWRGGTLYYRLGGWF